MDDDWDSELKFEHIDWVDISDAELSGNQEALEHLMNKSLELKRQASNSSIYGTPLSTTPLAYSTPNENLLGVPQSTPKEGDEALNVTDPLPFTSYLKQDDISLSKPMTHLSMATPTSFRYAATFRKPYSYAQIARGKAGKRKFAERVEAPPIEVPSKKHPIHALINSTPDVESKIEEDPCDEIVTPESNRPSRSAVQRRLFENIKFAVPSENHPPPWYAKENDEKIADPHILAQREKQIEFGKNTIGYETFVQTIPKWKRSHSDPWTPDKFRKCSTRSWQGQIRKWRRCLHKWDPNVDQEQFTCQDAVLCNIDLDNNENPLET
jgi:histone RNA hairpin-binding protein